jgi:hypothetical protein
MSRVSLESQLAGTHNHWEGIVFHWQGIYKINKYKEA